MRWYVWLIMCLKTGCVRVVRSFLILLIAIGNVSLGVLKTPFRIDSSNKSYSVLLFGGNRSGFLKLANVPKIFRTLTYLYLTRKIIICWFLCQRFVNIFDDLRNIFRNIERVIILWGNELSRLLMTEGRRIKAGWLVETAWR